MPLDDDDNGGPRRPDRLWRVEERQKEIVARLEHLQRRLDETIQRRDNHDWKLEQHMERVVNLLEDLSRRPTVTPTSSNFFGEPTVLKIVLGGLMSLVAALALGRAIGWPG
jgi:hypothetical protein